MEQLKDVLENLYAEKRYNEILQKVEEFLEQNPDHPEALDYKAECLWNLGESESAVQIYIDLARKMAQERQLSKALGYLRKATHIDPQHPLLQTLLEEISRQAVGVALTAEALSRCTLFEVLTPENFSNLASVSVWRLYMPGQSIITSGDYDSPPNIYILLRGKVKVIYCKNDEKVELAELQPGDIFGEVRFLTRRPRTADVVATTRCEVLEIPAEALGEMVRENPEIRKLLEKIYEERVFHTVEVLKRKR